MWLHCHPIMLVHEAARKYLAPSIGDSCGGAAVAGGPDAGARTRSPTPDR